MPFENNGTLQKWHMTNTRPEIDKYDTHKTWCLTKMVQLAKKMPKSYICQGLSGVIFKREFLNLLHGSDLWLMDFKVEIFPLQNDFLGTLLYRIAVGIGSIIHISRVLVVLQKTNNVVVRCH